MKDPTARFSDRVDYYVQSRPGYPAAIIPLLVQECSLSRGWTVADVGSGTGIFSRLLLEHGYRVFAVEPNPEMRAAAEKALGGHGGLVSVDGKAESTTLSSQSVQMITSAQAFHWFDRPQTRLEFERILVPGGWVVLIWNKRLADTPFQLEYADLLKRFSKERPFVGYDDIGAEELKAFYSPGAYRRQEFNNFQDLDFDGLKGRLLSASYMPVAADLEYGEMMMELSDIFARHARSGAVRLSYRTQVFFGRFVAG